MRFSSNTQEALNTMCNLFTTNGNGYGCCNTGVSWSVCRDCCGNLRLVPARNQSCCHCCNNGNTCNQGCGCGHGNGATTSTNTNANNGMGFSCFTVCGNTTNTANQSSVNCNGDAYYASQYGLGGNRNRCGCNIT